MKAQPTTVPGDILLEASSITLAKGTDLDVGWFDTFKSWLSSSELFSLWSVSSILYASISYLQHGMCNPCLLGVG